MGATLDTFRHLLEEVGGEVTDPGVVDPAAPAPDDLRILGRTLRHLLAGESGAR